MEIGLLLFVDTEGSPRLLLEDSAEVTGQPLTGLDKLPADLRAYVKEDNRLFEEELWQWDALQEKRKARAVVPASVMGPSRPRKVEPSPSAGESLMALFHWHIRTRPCLSRTANRH